MKRLFTFLLLVLFASGAHAQESENVTFIHGLGGTSLSLQEADNTLSDDFLINTRRLGYSSQNDIASIASSERGNVLSNSVVVGHSMGGIVAREMIRNDGSQSDIDALITSGSPHEGALIANQLASGSAQNMAENWVLAVSEGIRREVGFDFGVVAQALFDYLVDRGALGYLDFEIENYQSRVSAYTDLEVNSNFMNTLNADPDATLPQAHYAIHGVDERKRHLSLAASAMGQSYQNVDLLASGLGFRFLTIGWKRQATANQYFMEYSSTGDLYDYDLALYYQWLAEGHFISAWSLLVWQEIDWELLTQGSQAGGPSDALLPKSTTTPGFVSETREIQALGDVNHLELRDSQEAIESIREAFRKPDIDIPEAADDPPEDDPPPYEPPPYEPPECEDPTVIICEATTLSSDKE
ncbi:hypothetical protein CRI93_07325 [Longimonas halophila]|uniref:GPI inositol-deacylase PGAP1-like alpha/beta domain-containing protein n=1 Tax=Longimonas halophila TaxID=1469170 RepID=A0A2H3P588_9BACT|nr:hypothetical protein [Longimonas halophila]PEN06948.1 hypothetical protein CRI93_07325 [Longimonas halophila]